MELPKGVKFRDKLQWWLLGVGEEGGIGDCGLMDIEFQFNKKRVLKIG